MKQSQAIISLFLYAFMAVVIIALFMPTIGTVLTNGVNNVTNTTHGVFLTIVLNYYPVYLTVMFLIAFIILMRNT